MNAQVYDAAVVDQYAPGLGLLTATGRKKSRFHYLDEGNYAQSEQAAALCHQSAPAGGWVVTSDEDNRRNLSGVCARCYDEAKRRREKFAGQPLDPTEAPPSDDSFEDILAAAEAQIEANGVPEALRGEISEGQKQELLNDQNPLEALSMEAPDGDEPEDHSNDSHTFDEVPEPSEDEALPYRRDPEASAEELAGDAVEALAETDTNLLAQAARGSTTTALTSLLAPVPERTVGKKTAERSDAICPMCGKPLPTSAGLQGTQGLVRGMTQKCFARLQAFVDREYADAPADDPKPDLKTVDEERLKGLIDMCRDLTSFDLQREVPDAATLARDYVRLPDVVKAAKAAGKSVGSLVRAMGGDRAVKPPAAPYWQPVYVGTSRYLPKAAMDHLGELSAARTPASEPIPVAPEAPAA